MTLEREERWALWKLANEKAPLMDDIPIALLKAAGEKSIRVLITIRQKVCVTYESQGCTESIHSRREPYIEHRLPGEQLPGFRKKTT